jgi:N-acetylneuraminate epimerase
LFLRLTLFPFLLTSIHLLAQEKAMLDQWYTVDASTVSDLPKIGLAGQSALIRGDRLLVLGGSNFPDAMPWLGGKKKYYDQLWIYDIIATPQLKSLPSAVKYPVPIAYASAIAYHDQWIIMGGETPEGKIADVKTINTSGTENTEWRSLPSLPIPLANASAFVVDNIMHVAGGETGSVTSASHFTLDLNNPSKGWQFLQELPYPVSHAVLLKDEKNNRFLLLGGRVKLEGKPSIFYSSSLAFDLKTRQWKKAEPLPYPLAAGTGVVASNNQLLIFGGDKGDVFNQVETCTLEAAKSTDPGKSKAWDDKRKALQSSHPGFSREVLQWNDRGRKWIVIGDLSFPTPVTTQAVSNQKYIVIPGGETKAGLRTANLYIKKLELK